MVDMFNICKKVLGVDINIPESYDKLIKEIIFQNVIWGATCTAMNKQYDKDVDFVNDNFQNKPAAITQWYDFKINKKSYKITCKRNIIISKQ